MEYEYALWNAKKLLWNTLIVYAKPKSFMEYEQLLRKTEIFYGIPRNFTSNCPMRGAIGSLVVYIFYCIRTDLAFDHRRARAHANTHTHTHTHREKQISLWTRNENVNFECQQNVRKTDFPWDPQRKGILLVLAKRQKSRFPLGPAAKMRILSASETSEKQISLGTLQNPR